ncbi:MAG: hypothetical protein U5J78_00940 [Parasphingorhabdus sp.]|nr:hypothetical protein [Parasphingorhabdus sp.]
MEPWVFLSFFIIVVGIPVIGGIWAAMHKQRLKFEEKKLEVMGAQTAEKAAQYASQVELLEQRMRVLERIVTDRGFELSAQIEDLREPTARKELTRG